MLLLRMWNTGERQTERGTDRQREGQTDEETASQRDRQAGRQTDIQTGGQTDRQTGRPTDRQSDRQAGRQADRHRQTDTQIGRPQGPCPLTFFLSSSFSMGSTAQQGLARSVRSNLAYLQNPQALHRNGSFSS